MIAQQCAVPPGYPSLKDDYYSCIKDGMGESFEMLFDGKTFNKDSITSARIYAKYECQPVVVPPKKPTESLKPEA